MISELISESILKFYLKNLGNDETDTQKYFCEDKSLCFQKIYESLLSPIFKTAKGIQLSYDEYLCCYTALKPVFQGSVSIIRETQTETLKLKWLGNNSWCLLESTSNETDTTTRNVEKVLLLTAMVEYGLGCVYYTITEERLPPHLLRDLLSTSELLDFFGHEAITFLRVLMGTPNSINLRNIVWHGFPRPDDIPPYYVSILLLIVHSLGIVLEQKQLALKYRTQVQDFDQYISEIVVDLPIPTHADPNDIAILFENCCFIGHEYREYWIRLLSLLNDQRFANFVALILPQIELILRIKYGKLNGFDVSAKLDEYYITIDTIFEPVVPHKSGIVCANKLISKTSELNEGALKLLYDLFIAPSGPRLRDKVGHGEVTIEALSNKRVCDVLLYLSVHLLSGDDLRFPLDDYESKFHLNNRSKNALKEAEKALNNLAEMHLEWKKSNTGNFENIPSIETKLKIFCRPKKEAVYMLLIYKIADLLVKTCQNYKQSIATCQALLAQHELRSRRRRTLVSLLDALPKIHSCLRRVLECLLGTFQKLQATDLGGGIEHGDQLLKFLKHTLKISENFVKYSQKESNEWIRAIELCSTFLALRGRLYSIDDE